MGSEDLLRLASEAEEAGCEDVYVSSFFDSRGELVRYVSIDGEVTYNDQLDVEMDSDDAEDWWRE